MLTFREFTNKDLKLIQRYTKNNPYYVCDLSVGVMFMWQKTFNQEICVYKNTLIIKANFSKKKCCFFPPIGENVDEAITKIEDYCVKNELDLEFNCVDESFLEYLNKRYSDIESFYDRKWSDYLYDYTEMENFQGGKFSGQRNHINRFKKTYAGYKYKKITNKDIPKIKEFLTEYSKFHKGMKRVEKEEYLNTFLLLDEFKKGLFIGGMLVYNKKIIAVSVGEYSGKMLIIHTEKALGGYTGIYPTMFNEFTKHAKKDGILYINREDDAGDEGLRTSKTQYKPIKLVHKNYVKVKMPFNIEKKPILKDKGVVLNSIKKSDTNDYYKLYITKSLNKYWGYDFTKDFPVYDKTTFYNLQKNDFKNGKNLCLAIRSSEKSKMLGEVILYNFSFNNTVEVGIRLFKKYQNKGYATKSILLITTYAEQILQKTLVAKCYKQNISSQKLFEKCNFIRDFEDKKFIYYKRK